MSCPEGEIRRKRYVKQDGTIVKSSCIRATSLTGLKSSETNAPIIQKMLRKERAAERATSAVSPKECPEGMIRRSAYVRDAYVRSDGTSVARAVVPADCIRQQGKPKEAPGLYDPKTGERIYIIVGEDSLGKYGYSDLKHKTAAERHAALDRAYEGMGQNWLSLFRTLNYLAVVNQRHVKLHETLLADRNYVRRRYGKVTMGGEIADKEGEEGPTSCGMDGGKGMPRRNNKKMSKGW